MKIGLYATIIVLLIYIAPIKAQENVNKYKTQTTWQQIDAPTPEFHLHYDSGIKKKNILNIDTLLHRDIDFSFKYLTPPTKKPFTWHGNIYSHDFSKSGTLSTWDNGHISGFSSHTSFPIIGNIGSAGFGISHDFTERFNFSGNLSFSKYSLPRFAYNTYTLAGQFSYRFNKNLSVTAFSYYESNRFINNNRNNPYGSINMGGYLTAITNSNEWGVDMGVQRHFNPHKRKWVMVPVFRPFYNLGGNKLGFDLGGLLYQILNTVNLTNGNDDWDVRHDNKRRNGGKKNNILLPRKH